MFFASQEDVAFIWLSSWECPQHALWVVNCVDRQTVCRPGLTIASLQILNFIHRRFSLLVEWLIRIKKICINMQEVMRYIKQRETQTQEHGTVKRLTDKSGPEIQDYPVNIMFVFLFVLYKASLYACSCTWLSFHPDLDESLHEWGEALRNNILSDAVVSTSS